MTADHVPTPSTAAVHDRRDAPTGVLPRHLKLAAMVGLAFTIFLVIYLTGQPPRQASVPPPSASPASAKPTSPAQVARFAQGLKSAEPAAAPTAAARVATPTGATTAPARAPGRPGAAQPDAQAQRAAESLFADNVVSTRRPAADLPPAGNPTGTRSAESPSLGRGPAPASGMASVAAQAEVERLLAQLTAAGAPGANPSPVERHASVPVSLVPPAPVPEFRAQAGPAAHRSDEHPADGPRLRLSEGTVIETVLVTRLNGSIAGPVSCLVTTPVYSADRQQVLIPAGARVLGGSAPVQSWGDSRLAVSFHRLLMPDGHSYSLDSFRGLDAVGESGVTEDVNRHYLQVFGASAAIGALSGLAQLGTTTSGLSPTTFGDEYRQAAGSSLAASTGRVLDRYLNILPTITIREGYRIKVYLTSDVELPAYLAGLEPGGVR